MMSRLLTVSILALSNGILFWGMPSDYGKTAIAQEVNSPATYEPASPEEKELATTSKALSSTTLVGGEGWARYDSCLHDDFDRWSAKDQVRDRTWSSNAIREWWEAGNRQSSSEEELISLKIVGQTGILRKKISESYLDKDGKDAGSFEGYVTQVWLRESDRWLLVSVTIQRAADKVP